MKIKLYIEGKSEDCDHEAFEDLPDNWDAMSNEEKDNYLDEAAQGFLVNHVSYGAYVVDDDGKE
jgi:hypothetical protein